jgi:hypothetical protein
MKWNNETLCRGRRMRERDGGGKPNQYTMVIIFRNVTMNPPVQLMYANKNALTSKCEAQSSNNSATKKR